MRTSSTISDLNTPIAAFLRLQSFDPVFMIENVEHSGVPGRFSYIGLDPISRITYDSPEGEVDTGNPPFLNMLREELARLSPPPAEMGRIPTGLVGVTCFEVFREFEKLETRKPQEIGLHDAVFVVPKLILCFDHFNHSMSIYQTNSDEPDAAVVKEIRGALRSSIDPKESGGSFSRASTGISPEEFKNRIRSAKDRILEGDVLQVVLSLCYTGETDIDPFSIYRALRFLNPSPYLYYLNLGGMYVLGCSPETLVRVEGDSVTMRPMGGTRPRSADPEEDMRLEAELLSDDKDSAEHMIRVDSARNDLARVCLPGSLRVPELKKVDHYSHVMHIVSTVTGVKQPEADIFDVFRAAFPAGTTTGTPKCRAVDIITELEDSPRGPYGGSVGFFSPGGSMDQAIAIRTMVIKDNQYRLQVGGGIVADSVPQDELTEIGDKGSALLQALEFARDEL